MADRHEVEWPISRWVVRESCRRSDIPPLSSPTPIRQLDGSDRYQWVRFEVPFSRLSIERLPMTVDRETGLWMDDEARLAWQIARSFTEPISDMVITRRGRWHYLATFTIYTATATGRDSFMRRKGQIKIPWETWAAQNR